MLTRFSASKLLRLGLTLGAMALSMGSSCLNPCEQLAQKICSCEPTQFERDACNSRVSVQVGQRQPTNDDRLYCQQKLAECECRDLQEGRLEACGLARE